MTFVGGGAERLAAAPVEPRRGAVRERRSLADIVVVVFVVVVVACWCLLIAKDGVYVGRGYYYLRVYWSPLS